VVYVSPILFPPSLFFDVVVLLVEFKVSEDPLLFQAFNETLPGKDVEFSFHRKRFLPLFCLLMTPDSPNVSISPGKSF